MATSITQAKPLLTAAELALFEDSRAEPIKAFSVKQLAGKEKRTRTLRDKYRDLYRRQTVATRGKTQGASDTGDANARTQRKADILQEMLDRFEARSGLLEKREAQADKAQTPKTKTLKPADKAVASAAPAQAKSVARAKKPVDGTKQRGASAQTVSAPVSTPAKRKPRAAPQPGKAKSAKADMGRPHPPEQALSAVGSLNPVKGGETQPGHFVGKNPAARSPKAPSPRAPTSGGKAQAPKVNAPLDMVAAAKRVNPVKNSPSSQAIQGHVSASVRRSQGKRDSR